MKVQLKIKEFPGKRYATAGFTPKTEHLPAFCRDEHGNVIRTKIRPGEIFEVQTKEEATPYLKQGFVEIVL